MSKKIPAPSWVHINLSARQDDFDDLKNQAGDKPLLVFLRQKLGVGPAEPPGRRWPERERRTG